MTTDLADIIRQAIELKQGNKEFALFYEPSFESVTVNAKPWIAEIGNPSVFVRLGESTGEYCGEGDSPEDAIRDLIENLKSAEAPHGKSVRE